MDNRIRKSLGGIPLRINFRTPRQVENLRQRALEFHTQVTEAGDDLEASKAATQAYYKDASDLMFEFTEEVPDDFFDYEDFPQGEFEYLQQLFMNPTKEM